MASFSYLISFELLGRMGQTAPLIPYEMGKYLLFVFLCAGIVNGRSKSKVGWVLLILLLPAFFFDASGEVVFSDIVFNALGAVNLCLIVIFLRGQTFTKKRLIAVLKLCIYPILAVLPYLWIKNPSLNEIEFELTANFSTTAGFGSNQVSTMLGLGAFLMFIFVVNKWEFSGFKALDYILVFLFTFQGLITFSRGGMVGALVGVLIIMASLAFAPRKALRYYRLPNLNKYVFFGVLIVIGSFFIVDGFTDGALTLRYQGETAGTLSGSKEKSLNTLTTGRYDIFFGDLELWFDHLIMGVGVGASKYMRIFHNGVVAHVELSRLLSEHGVFGLLFSIILVKIGFGIKNKNVNPMINAILISFFVIALYTTFHAAMRTYITPLLVGLSLLNVRK
ncbi:hypothetical protein [Algoriphagus sp. NG3]|uniref:hypothetical protein n=1 Tax=Algoriphagus sp. NG3 TaxID=3097546 RepID=UPI002A837459|nr:hypothetical protein [Algoriphagus sp. NG3]WPR77798.1 hypothetical protein SLW71_10620 [Algoriphagus sp. NG3]